MSNPIGAVDAGVSVIQTQLGFQNMVNTSDPVTQLNEMAQMAAGVSNLIGSPIAAINTNASAALVTIGKMELDARDGKSPSVGDVLSLAGNLVSMAVAAAIVLSPAGRAAGILAKAAIGLGMGQALAGGISAATASGFNGASKWQPPRDPLTLDLDGDGLETVGISTTNPILFDHDGDGVKTATGWISPDDGFLVLDRNGNGTIDTGRELFGDSTPLAGGGNAVDGFAALAQEDTNLDGKVNAADARFADLRIWRDLNQDGISQSGELSTLAALGIASINVAKTENSTLLANGNVIADLGTYTKTDGSLGTLGDTAQLGDLDLASNTFISQFTDSIPITAEAAALPGMQGSGQVRDLREAASLSGTLATALSNYAAAPTRDAQTTQLDTLLKAWSDTSTIETTATGAYAGHALTITFAGVTNGSAEYLAWLTKLTVLERFNRRTFQAVPVAANADVWEQAA